MTNKFEIISEDIDLRETVRVSVIQDGVSVFLDRGSIKGNETAWSGQYYIRDRQAILSIDNLYRKLNKWNDSTDTGDIQLSFGGDTIYLTYEAVSSLHDQLDDIYHGWDDD